MGECWLQHISLAGPGDLIHSRCVCLRRACTNWATGTSTKQSSQRIEIASIEKSFERKNSQAPEFGFKAEAKWSAVHFNCSVLIIDTHQWWLHFLEKPAVRVCSLVWVIANYVGSDIRHSHRLSVNRELWRWWVNWQNVLYPSFHSEGLKGTRECESWSVWITWINHHSLSLQRPFLIHWLTGQSGNAAQCMLMLWAN